MKLIKSSVEIIPQEYSLEGIYKQIEKAARICYKSEDKITEDSADKMVNALINSKHNAMLEHATIYLFIPETSNEEDCHIAPKYYDSPFSKTKIRHQPYMQDLNGYYITTNYRVLVENNWLSDLKFICEPSKKHEKRITVKFITSIGIGREILRHRTMSFANESTRYCNYFANKHNKEITFIEPYWYNNRPNYSSEQISKSDFRTMLCAAERHYFTLLNNGLKPEEAREMLPLCTKSELIVTGFISDWKHFFNLRYFGTTGKPHPDIKILAEDLYKQFQENDFI